MIDYIKAYTYDPVLAARLRMHVCESVEVNHNTGEIHRGEFSGNGGCIRFRVFESNRIEIGGSLQKYHRGNNYTDFTLPDVRHTVFAFTHGWGFDPERTFLSNLEFGVNLKLNQSVVGLLGAVVGLSCGAVFNEAPKRGKYCQRRDYRIKIYNKSAQVKYAPDNLFRYELHVDKMRKVMPVKTLHDLTIESNWKLLEGLLLKHFAQIIFADQYNLKNAPPHLQNFYYSNSLQIVNSRFWRDVERTKRFRCLRAVNELQAFAVNNWSNATSELIRQKLSELRCPQRMLRSITG